MLKKISYKFPTLKRNVKKKKKKVPENTTTKR